MTITLAPQLLYHISIIIASDKCPPLKGGLGGFNRLAGRATPSAERPDPQGKGARAPLTEPRAVKKNKRLYFTIKNKLTES